MWMVTRQKASLLCVGLSAWYGLSGELLAQKSLFGGQTIPQAAEAIRPHPLVTMRVSDGTMLPFDDQFHKADLVVEGTLSEPKAYLTPNQMQLYTDYRFSVAKAWRGRPFAGTRRPGENIYLTVKTWGGDTDLNGVRVQISDPALTPLPLDTTVLLLLQFDATDGKYAIAEGGSYAYQIRDGRTLQSLTKHMTPSRINGQSAEQALERANARAPLP